VGDDPKQREAYEAELQNAEIARTLFELRTKAHLAQEELAERVGTTASVISRLEDARYQGHSLSMLRRIAAALNLKLQIRFLLPSGAVSKTVPRVRRAGART
jgi:transcriptional regulator with XRE-family HTH domain